MNVELFVGLKIPDTTAITTFHTIEKMGYKDVKGVKREIYYKFDVEGGAEQFAGKIGKVDILVNANKNKFSNSLEKEEGAVYVLVKDIDDKCEGLLHTLKERLGLNEIKSMEKGVLWTLYVDSEKRKISDFPTSKSKNFEEIAKEIADRLLHNENYQEISLL